MRFFQNKKNIILIIILISLTSYASACPNGYLPVPPLAPYTTHEFCVMKYEAKDDGNKKPVSKPSGAPWNYIDRTNAILKCRSIGVGFDLISNEQWQTIARNIAGVDTNWSGNKVGSGEFKIDPKYNSLPAPEGDPKQSWSKEKRSHNLSNGNMIWDFAGNVSEYVSNDAVAFTDLEVLSSGRSEKNQVSFKNTGDIYQINYGAASNTICAFPQKSPYCGMGKLNLPLHVSIKSQAEISYEYCAANFSKRNSQALYICGKENTNFPRVESLAAIHRGGANGYGVQTGIFAVEAQGTADNKTGFRCVYNP